MLYISAVDTTKKQQKIRSETKHMFDNMIPNRPFALLFRCQWNYFGQLIIDILGCSNLKNHLNEPCVRQQFVLNIRLALNEQILWFRYKSRRPRILSSNRDG